ncbi:MAG: EFR1 family ferrodoxin [Oscillospiraceae bacterium]|nr:EFR1 family ferrodoxin [Oscillospiraceae bacterium]
MIGIYFSGTGNTKYCTEKFIEQYNGKLESIYSIEDENVIEKIKSSKDILFAYPIYYSSMPKIVKQFIQGNSEMWQGKNIFILVTQSMYSGDGAGTSARLFKRYGANILGGLHIKMPDNIGDLKIATMIFKEKHNKKKIVQADNRIKEVVKRYKSGKKLKDGLTSLSRVMGIANKFYINFNVKIDDTKCSKCAICIRNCPTNNLKIDREKVISQDSCTLCYRCYCDCPRKAIAIFGSKVREQYRIDKYIQNN